jgi:C1A family cysteine protease
MYESFMTEKVATTGVADLPQKNEEWVGAHAVCAVGYDDQEKRLLVRNSWGSDWGMGGYFTMPYSYLNSDLSRDFWTIRK